MTDIDMKIQRKVNRGDVLLKEEPFVYVLCSKLHSEYCDNCFKKGKLLKCSSCQYVYYCGKECQRESWSIHKPECPNIRRVLPKVVPDAARLLARLIHKLKKGGDLIKSYYTEGNFRMFKDLMSHYSDLKDNPKKMEHFVSLCGVLFEFLGASSLPNSAELMGMYGRMSVNSFNICDGELVTMGTGIYLGGSIVDHSCQPNAVATFQGTTLYIRAAKDMPYLDWSQIFISYIDVMNTPKTRQEELQYGYYFLCQCVKCLDPKQPVFSTGAACPNRSCDACIDMTGIPRRVQKKCYDCDTKISDDFVQTYREVTELTDTHFKNMQGMTYLDVCKFCLKKQRGVLYKHNYQYIKTLDLAFQSSIDFNQWEVAKEYGSELLEGYRIYYGEIHPLLGLLHLKIGKILLYEENSREALAHLKNAYEILKVTHGHTSQLFRTELMPLLHQAKMEQ